MALISFTIPGIPQGKGRARVFSIGGKSRAVTPEKTVIYENLIKSCYIEETGNLHMGNFPLKMRINAYYQIPKSASKKKSEQMEINAIRPTTKPDCDNIGKVIADALNGIAYADDSQIIELMINKYYSHQPRVQVIIEVE